jgi:23S rRNA pseudouridine1911/1915/1917 synthase
VIVDATNAGRRIDVLVRKLLPEVSLGTLMKWIRTGRIRCNGAKVLANHRVQEGDVLLLPVDVHTPHAPPPKPSPMPEVVYEDEHLLVVYKPVGMVCHVGTLHEQDSLMHRVEGYLGTHHALPGSKPGLAQRLDKDVSGLVPIGKNAVVLRAMAQQVADGTMDKTYTALVVGQVKHVSGKVDVPLRVDDEPMGNKPRVFPDPVHGKPSCTLYERCAVGVSGSVLNIRILTGRTHQIRAHMKHAGHPLVGDPRYGDASFNAFMKTTHGVGHVCLHAGRLEMKHPHTGEPMVFEVLPPSSFIRAAEACGLPKAFVGTLQPSAHP